METKIDIRKVINDCGFFCHRISKSEIDICEKANLIFNSICSSVIDKEICFPQEVLKKEISNLSIESELMPFIHLTKSLNISLFSMHYRSPQIDGGRIYCTRSENEMENMPSFHDKLLRLYFTLFGRINTFNERMFEYFFGVNNNDAPKMFRARFNAEVGEKIFIATSNSYAIQINKNLAESLAPMSLIHRILNPKNVYQGFDWYQYLKSEGLKDDLDNHVERQWNSILCDENTIIDWQDLLLFLDLVPSSKEILKWNPTTKIHLKRALKFLQGILIYRYFAPEEIVTILTKINDGNEIFGITAGFKTKKNSTISFINDFCEEIKEFGSEIFSLSNRRDFEMKEKTNPVLVFNKAWEDIKVDTRNDIILFSKCAEIVTKAKELVSAKHETEELEFTFYFGKQTSLSRFNETYNFAEFDINNLYKSFDNYLENHYSLFQDKLDGLFFDILNPKQISLVKPLSILPNIISSEEFSLDQNLILQNKSNENILKLLTNSDSHLLVLRIEPRQMKIFYKGQLYLRWPDKDFNWARSSFGPWSDESKLSELILKIFSFNKVLNDKEKKNITNLFTKAILKTSNESGKGAMLLFGNNDGELLKGCKSKLNNHQIGFWQKKQITECNLDDLYDMIIPDGATLINLHLLAIENQIHVTAIVTNEEIPDSQEEAAISRGTRHKSARAMSKFQGKELLIICISSDGPVTVFYNGKELAYDDLSQIDLKNEK